MFKHSFKATALVLALITAGCGGGADPTASGSLPGSVESRQAVSFAAPQNGIWWNPTQSGRGYTLEVQGSQLVFTMYLYEDSGAASWNTGILNQQSDGSYTGTLSRFSGGQSLNGAYVAPTGASTVGTVSLSFPTTSTGTAVLTPSAGGAAISLPLQKYIFSTTAGTGVTPIFQSGVWWSATESGRGYFVETQGDQVSIGSYMYDTAGQPVWYTTLVTLQSGGTTASGPLLQFANGQTLTGAYKAPNLLNTTIGTLRFSATSSTTANLTLPNGNVTALTRYQFNSNTTPVASAADGKVLYTANCTECHTSNPQANVSKVLNGANAPTTILKAISNNTGGMGVLKTRIGTSQAADLAAYLATPGI